MSSDVVHSLVRSMGEFRVSQTRPICSLGCRLPLPVATPTLSPR